MPKPKAQAKTKVLRKEEPVKPAVTKEHMEFVHAQAVSGMGETPKGASVVVKHLWDDRFRVNVYHHPPNDGVSYAVQMLESYFVRASETEVLRVDPQWKPIKIPEKKEEGPRPMGKVR